ncbi:hypothetical protein [Streptomyces purpurogeneiscleroticus]|uniref:hypothetical protein n=1 Tax=Streptomyces purpurogeneiscleroticus TaxID=68259 RepID=UPI001CBE17A7|nr:hypothetical protein [Streptomyces purpurogeneiscleroticus]MBZ4014716.1 hypothetical protein [Streptomyces purpurogeneiscleroticus]
MGSRRWFGGRLLVGAVSVVALTVTGCGSDDGGDDIASAGNGKTGASATKSSAGELAEYVEGQRKWVKCLRDAGLDVPDPDAKGRVDFGDNAKWKRDQKALQAQEKCADLSLPVPDSVQKAQQPELSKKEIGKNREYATCMQENGAADFPDTGEDGHFRDVQWDSTSAGAKRAARECASIIGIPENAPSPKG